MQRQDDGTVRGFAACLPSERCLCWFCTPGTQGGGAKPTSVCTIHCVPVSALNQIKLCEKRKLHFYSSTCYATAIRVPLQPHTLGGLKIRLYKYPLSIKAKTPARQSSRGRLWAHTADRHRSGLGSRGCTPELLGAEGAMSGVQARAIATDLPGSCSRGPSTFFSWHPVFHGNCALTEMKDEPPGPVNNGIIKWTLVSQQLCGDGPAPRSPCRCAVPQRIGAVSEDLWI